MLQNIFSEINSVIGGMIATLIILGMIFPSVSDTIRDNKTIGPRMYNILVLVLGYISIIYLYLSIKDVEINIIVNTTIFVFLIPTYARVKDVFHIGHKATTYLLIFGFLVSYSIFYLLNYIETVNKLYLIIILSVLHILLEILFFVIKKILSSKKKKRREEKEFDSCETKLNDRLDKNSKL